MADPGAAVATTAELQSPKGILKNKEDGLNRSMEDLTVVYEETGFWEPGKYKTALKRVENGSQACDTLCKMLLERAAVEQKYAKEMGKWSERWKAKCNAMTVDSTLADAWKAFVQAGEKLTELHGDVKVTIEAELVPEIQEFKKARFPKGFGGFKAAKQASKEFDAAQKPWEKRKAKIQKARAQVLTKEAVIEEMRQGSSSAKAINKKEAELLRLRGGMGTRIAEIYEYRATYETQVGSTFTRLQDEERERVTFFKDIFARYHAATDVSTRFLAVSTHIADKVAGVDSDKDLDVFSMNHGIKYALMMPDPNGDFNMVTHYGDNVTGLGLGFRKDSSSSAASLPRPGNTTSTPMPSVAKPAQVLAPSAAGGGGGVAGLDGGAGTDTSIHANVPPPSPHVNFTNSTRFKGGVNFMGNDMPSAQRWSMNPTMDELKPGTTVYALYDYTGTNSDELSFAFDDEFTIQESISLVEPGWIKVTNSQGALGIVPANYVEIEMDT